MSRIHLMPHSQRNPPTTPIPTCKDCGLKGHVKEICPRGRYNGNLPALSCSSCVWECYLVSSDDSNIYEIYLQISQCNDHKSPTIRHLSSARSSQTASRTIAAVAAPCPTSTPQQPASLPTLTLHHSHPSLN